MSLPLVTRSFTVDEYHRMAKAGILREDDRVELLDGQVVEMSPIGPGHAACVRQLARLLHDRAGHAILVAVQDPVVLGRHWEPQPDLAALRPRPDAYRQRHPEAADVLLIVEVADTTALHDRGVKVPAYAAAGVPEVWLVDLERDQVEVHRSPTSQGYRDVRTLGRGETVTPLLVALGPVEVREILG